MKKITCAMVMVAGLGASMSALAAGTNLKSGAFVDAAGTNGYACAQLGEGVTINLSKNISAAYDCIAATTDIRVATCHLAGSSKATSIDCAVIGVAADGTTPVFNDATCNGTTGQTYPIASYRVFEGSSKGGTVAPVSLGSNCTDATVVAVPFLP